MQKEKRSGGQSPHTPKSHSNSTTQRYLLLAEIQRIKRSYRAFCRLLGIVKAEYQRLLADEKHLEEQAEILFQVIEYALEQNSQKGGDHE